MLEMYEEIGAEKITKEVIVLNYTEDRMSYFDMFFLFTVGMWLMISVVDYSRQELPETLFTIKLIVFVSMINLLKKKIWSKMIFFNRKKGTIMFKRGLPYVNKRFNYSEVEILTKITDVIDDEGDRQHFKHYWIRLKDTNKKYRICKTVPYIGFDGFIENYMNSEKETIENLVDYKKDKRLKSYFKESN